MKHPTRSPSILDDIKQSTPFASEAQGVLASLSRTADDVKRSLSRALEPSGLTLEQYNILWILRDAGPEGLPTLDVADRMIRRNPGVTRLIDRLLEKGLVSRRRSAKDRRRVFVRLTGAGRDLLEGYEDTILSTVRQMTRCFQGHELLSLGESLDRLRRQVNADNT